MTLSKKLNHARALLGLTLRQVEAETDIGASSLSDFENGKRSPSFRQLDSLARLYRRTIGYFFDEAEPQPDVILWRERPEKKVAAGIEADFSRLCEQFHNLERWIDDQVPTSLPVCPDDLDPESFNNAQAESLAAYVRKELQLGDRPGDGLLRTLEEVCGVKIFQIHFEPSGTAACTVNESFGAAVLLNASNLRWTRNSDLAHELFHLITWRLFRHAGETTASQADPREEGLANRFARALLMPIEPVQNAVTRSLKNNALQWCDIFDIARQFDVSFEALLWRIGSAFKLDDAEVCRAIEDCKEIATLFEKRKADMSLARPERFSALAIQCLNKGRFSAGRFAEYMGISRQEAQAYLAHEACDDEKIEIPAA